VLWTYAAGAFWAAQTAGRLIAPLSIRRLGESRLLTASLVGGCAASLAMASVATTAAQVIGIAALIGFALAPVFPLLWARVLRQVAPRQPSAIGPLFAAGGVGGAVLPWLVGLVSGRYGLDAGLFVPMAALAVMVALLALRPARMEAP
jgi:MFS transporter, FHS family, glucose/mannose:H+ symporter